MKHNEEKLDKIITAALAKEGVTTETAEHSGPILELGLDSLATMNMLFEINEQLAIQVPDNELFTITVEELQERLTGAD